MKSLAADIPRRVIDPCAETSSELCAATGQSSSWMKEYCRKMVLSGKWERVWKKVHGQAVPAYRRAK